MYEPDGYKPTYLIVDGRSLALVRNEKYPRTPRRFRNKTRALTAVEKLNDAAAAEYESNHLNAGELE